MSGWHPVDLAGTLIAKAGQGTQLDQQSLDPARPVDDRQLIVMHGNRRAFFLPIGQVGEIWIHGPSVADGYWSRDDPFESKPNGTDALFFRSGDLGFLHDGELFVTGRIKDLLIVRGRNLYPQDVEMVVEEISPALRQGGGATFSLEESDEEIAVVHEVKARLVDSLDDLLMEIGARVTEQFDVMPALICLIEPGQLPKTTSGKVQRRKCRERLLAGELATVAVRSVGPRGQALQDAMRGAS